MDGNNGRFHVRRKDKEISDFSEIEQIMKKATVCCLGLIDRGEAYVVPVNFGYERNTIYFHSALEGRKVDLMKRSNRVGFAVYNDITIVESPRSNCTVKYRSVLGSGLTYIVEDKEDKIHGLKAIMRQCAGNEYGFAEDRVEKTLVVRIEIENMTGKRSL
jgi:nitroimidazol reductase NimA-like FMN-containing flavoprotein (pyridoxamine 5'-phosphate oxidase superfamily)